MLVLQFSPDTFLLLHMIGGEGEWYTLEDQQNTKINGMDKRVQKD